MMNPADLYRRQAVYTAPLQVQLAQMHELGAKMTREIAEFAEAGKIEEARGHIRHLQDMITFLRSSLDMDLEVSQSVDATYAFYYQVLVRWYLNPNEYASELPAFVAFWESWGATWRKVQSTSPQQI